MPSKGVLAWLRFQKCLSSYKYKTDYPKYDYFYITLLSESFSPWSFLQKMCQITTSFNLVWKSWWQWFGTFFGENETIAGQKNALRLHFFTFFVWYELEVNQERLLTFMKIYWAFNSRFKIQLFCIMLLYTQKKM